jgi:hypothetical protein
MLTSMCGFAASDANAINKECSRAIDAWRFWHPGPVPEEVISHAMLWAVDEHVATMPAAEQERLAEAVRKLHEAFAEPDGLLEVQDVEGAL